MGRLGATKESNCEQGGDLVEQLMTAVREKPGFSEGEARAMVFTTIGAGHETTASSTISILGRICSNPDLQRLVEQETRGDILSTAFEDRPRDVTGACIKEAMRLHSVTNFSLMRTVPANGLQLHGYCLPSGISVGCNPTVLPRSVELFGADAAEFKPTRWLDLGNEVQVKKMEKYNLMFGSATRSCPGQNIARLIIATLVPRLFREFDIEMEIPPGAFENYPPFFLTLLKDSRIRFLERGC
jgi:cytochrome P450